jgi:ribosomal protein S12 methylthiotransferase accessory factor
LLRKILGAGDFAFTDDPISEIAQPTGSERVDVLCEKLTRTGLRVRLVAMRAEPFPAAVLASIHDTQGNVERLAVGCGCAWSPVDAAVRAVTEAAQARIADIQGARENILRWDDPPSRFSAHTRRRLRLPHGRWYFDGPVQQMQFTQLRDGSSDDLADEVRRLIAAIGSVASRVAVVDLSPADRAFAVVRVIVPELETTLMDGRLGRIGRAIVDAAS